MALAASGDFQGPGRLAHERGDVLGKAQSLVSLVRLLLTRGFLWSFPPFGPVMASRPLRGCRLISPCIDCRSRSRTLWAPGVLGRPLRLLGVLGLRRSFGAGCASALLMGMLGGLGVMLIGLSRFMLRLTMLPLFRLLWALFGWPRCMLGGTGVMFPGATAALRALRLPTRFVGA